MKIKITADSTCDLSQALIEKYNVRIIPLIIVKGTESLKDGEEIQPQEVFDYFQEGKRICSTSAVNVSGYREVFAEYAAEYDAVVHFNISSGFSSTCQNAKLAAEEFENVYVVDTKNLSTGSGLVVMQGAELAAAGFSAAEIVSRLEDFVKKVEASFVIDTLEYLYKGGRCSSVTALATGLLKIKPCIEVVNGNMKVGRKYRGSFEHCLKLYVHDRLKNRDDIDTSRIFVTHTGCDPRLVAEVKEIIKSYFDFDEILETVAGCTISSHCGPNTLGILFVRK
ncbi:MAG: DegV family protein [Bacillota bacterium]|jgi:DegV family protein with EDD domain